MGVVTELLTKMLTVSNKILILKEDSAIFKQVEMIIIKFVISKKIN